jgi:hypothetical protein
MNGTADTTLVMIMRWRWASSCGVETFISNLIDNSNVTSQPLGALKVHIAFEFESMIRVSANSISVNPGSGYT